MKKLLLIISSVWLSLWLMGYIMDVKYKKYWWPFFEKIDVLVKDSSYYDGIFLGDSRVHFGINPKEVDSITGFATYNMGMGGTPVKEIEYTVNTYLKKHPAPKFVVLSIGYSGLREPEKYFYNPCYYFFYSSDSLTNTNLQLAGYHTTLFKIFPFLKYTAFDDFNKLSIAQNIQGKTILKPGGVAYKGFINNAINTFNINPDEGSEQQDTSIVAGLTIFDKTISLLQSAKSKVLLVYPPEATFGKKTRTIVESRLDTAIVEIAKQHGCSLYYFDRDTSFTKNYFTDAWHLNLSGTVLYSRKIAEMIKKEMSSVSKR